MKEVDAKALDSQGLSLFSARRFADAAECFRRATAAAPNVAHYHEHLGMTLLVLNQTREAESSFKRALSLAPDNFSSLLYLGCLMQAQNREQQSDQYFRRANEVNPNSFEGRFRWALALLQFGNLVQGEAQARVAISLKPEFSDGYELLGGVLSQTGRLVESVAAYERALSLHPQNPASVLHGIVSNKKVTESDRPIIERMEGLLAGGRLSGRSELVLHVSLGKALDDLGQYGACMAHFERARGLALKLNGGVRLNRPNMTMTVENFRQFFPGDVIGRYAHGIDTELPIFIVGMPRAGTTLLEQILSSHPDIGAGGELEFWRRSPISADPRLVFQPEMARRQAKEYQKLLQTIGPGKKRVIDKMLPNYALLGPFHILFPTARFIHCKRHPVDTCLSILMNTLLLETPPEYVYDLGDMVFAYRAYEDLMAHWRKVLPAECLLEVDYEDLVTDRESMTRKIIQFCGLEWDDASLHPERNDRLVKTPSKWQVRQPVYRTSVERWRRYEPWLGSLRELLTDLG